MIGIFLALIKVIGIFLDLIVIGIMNSKFDSNLTKVIVKRYVTWFSLIILLILTKVKSGMEKVKTINVPTSVNNKLNTKLNRLNKLID